MFALVDIEGIHTYRIQGKTHICTRKMCILHENGKDSDCCEFVPCIDLNDIGTKFKGSFDYCTKNVHKLDYYPKEMSMPCVTAATRLRKFIEKYNIEMIFYKGGHLEKDICESINIASFNIEDFGVPKVKSHDPYEEVHIHLDFLRTYCLEEIIILLERFRLKKLNL